METSRAVWPGVSTVTRTLSPARSGRLCNGESKRSNVSPSRPRMRSPGSRPAAAAGEFGCTSASKMLARSASGPERTNISRKATAMFMATPATITNTFEVRVARSQPAGSVSPSSLPAMRTKPPSGRALIVSSVRRPRSSVKRRGGNPMPNSGTSMPRSRATMRWPSSCTTMSGTTRSTNASTGPAMPVRISIRRPHSIALRTS